MGKDRGIPVKNHADYFRDCEEIFSKIESGLLQSPVNFDMINEALFKLTDPKFKYPIVKKCCKTCHADEQTATWRKALDELKKIEGVNDTVVISNIFETCRLKIYGVEDYDGKMNKHENVSIIQKK